MVSYDTTEVTCSWGLTHIASAPTGERERAAGLWVCHTVAAAQLTARYLRY